MRAKAYGCEGGELEDHRIQKGCPRRHPSAALVGDVTRELLHVAFNICHIVYIVLDKVRRAVGHPVGFHIRGCRVIAISKVKVVADRAQNEVNPKQRKCPEHDLVVVKAVEIVIGVCIINF